MIRTGGKITRGRIAMKDVQVEVEGPFDIQTFIKLQEKSGEIVREVVNAVEIVEEALCAENPEKKKKAAEDFSKVCKEGIETIKSSFPEVLINWSLSHLIKSLEESILSGNALMQGDEQGFTQHFQKSTELMYKQGIFIERLKANFQ